MAIFGITKADLNVALWDLERFINYRIRHMEDRLMASLDDLRAKIAELEAAADSERAEVAAGLARIAELVAAGSPDVAPEVARLQAVIDGLRSDDPAPPAPPADVPPV